MNFNFGIVIFFVVIMIFLGNFIVVFIVINGFGIVIFIVIVFDCDRVIISI